MSTDDAAIRQPVPANNFTPRDFKEPTLQEIMKACRCGKSGANKKKHGRRHFTAVDVYRLAIVTGLPLAKLSVWCARRRLHYELLQAGKVKPRWFKEDDPSDDVHPDRYRG